MSDRQDTEPDPFGDEWVTADEATAEESEESEESEGPEESGAPDLAEILSGRSNVAEPLEEADTESDGESLADPVEYSTSATDADVGSADDGDGLMEPVAVERGIPLINDLKQRLGSWLNK